MYQRHVSTAAVIGRGPGWSGLHLGGIRQRRQVLVLAEVVAQHEHVGPPEGGARHVQPAAVHLRRHRAQSGRHDALPVARPQPVQCAEQPPRGAAHLAPPAALQLRVARARQVH